MLSIGLITSSAAAVFLMYHNIEGWGYFIFIAIILALGI